MGKLKHLCHFVRDNNIVLPSKKNISNRRFLIFVNMTGCVVRKHDRSHHCYLHYILTEIYLSDNFVRYLHNVILKQQNNKITTVLLIYCIKFDYYIIIMSHAVCAKPTSNTNSIL